MAEAEKEEKMAATESSRLNKTPFHASEPRNVRLADDLHSAALSEFAFSEAKRSKWVFFLFVFFTLREFANVSDPRQLY